MKVLARRLPKQPAMHRIITVCLVTVTMLFIKSASCAEAPTLALERTILLGDVKGRIDHLAVDPGRQRLFVAELGNDTVGVVDLRTNQVRQRIADLQEPQGLGYSRSTDTLYVANGGDGSVRLFKGDELKPVASLKLGGDADNVRIDQASGTVLVGYGSGAIAVIDAKTHSRMRDIPLDGHPESFQIGPSNSRIYINVPEARQIAIVDRQSGHAARILPITDARSNFPMALDEDAQHLLVVFRDPPLLRTMTLDGQRVADVEVCRDSDDVFVDGKRHRLYVICGQGAIDVLGEHGERLARVVTNGGARTGLFVPELDRLFVAVPSRGGRKAAILVFRPDNAASHESSPTEKR